MHFAQFVAILSFARRHPVRFLDNIPRLRGNVMPSAPAIQTIDDYIAACPAEVRAILRKIRSTIRKAAPKAKEKISYKMPAFALEGDLIYFAAFKNHIGIFPPVRGDDKLGKAIARYRGEKGNLRLPLHESMPYGLITRIVKCRMKEQAERVRAKRKEK